METCLGGNKSRRTSFLIEVAIGALLALQGCATSTKRIELNTVPAGAEVSIPDGPLLGKTPLVLENERYGEYVKNGRLRALFSAPGHMEREVLIEVGGNETYSFRLRPYDADFFSARLLKDYPGEANSLSRELVEMQGLVFAGKIDEASRRLDQFLSRYPMIAAAHVLFASIESQRKNWDKAMRYLERAQALDPMDPLAARLIARIRAKGETTQ